MIRDITKIVTLEQHDTCSNHVWKYEIDCLKPEVSIWKNGEWKRTWHYVNLPIADSWLLELREGL